MNRTFSTTLKLSACFFLLTIAVGCLEENGTSSPSGQVPSQPAPIIVTTTSPCESNKVTIKSGGITSEYASIQLAVNAAQIGQVIHVPRGEWKELVSIVSKENVEISSQCFPSIYGFEISKSKNLKISGFKVLGRPVIISASKNPEKEDREDDNDEDDDQDDDNELESGSAGFYLKGGSKGNTNIEISKNEILGISSEFDAIYVGSQNSVKIIKNSIHDNKRNGISFSDSSKGGSHLIEQNQISYNGRNGIVIAKQQTVLIKGNRITYNGIRAPAATKVGTKKSDDDSKDGSHKDGYGIKRHGGGDDGDDDDKKLKMGSRKITLIDNVIYNNNGRKNKKSSRDISFYKSIFDSEDINNMTTEGYEGSGSVIFVDKIAPRFVSFTEDHIVTKFNQFYLYGFVDDVSKVNSDIYLNGVKIFSTSSNVINVIATLSEGVNTFTFKATDSAGNSADIVILSDIRYDTTPPVLSQLSPATGSKLYTNKFPFSFMSYGLSNEPLSKVSVGGFSGALEVNKINFSGSLQVDDVGIFQIDYAASDLVGNSATFATEVEVVFDNVAPIIATDLLPGTRTKDTTYPLSVNVSDLSPIWAEVWVNGSKVFGTAAINFTFNVPLNLEGENTVEVKAQDAAGNIATAFQEKIIRDTTPPVLSFVTPLNDGFVNGVRFKINVTSNEPLTEAKLNDRVITLSSPVNSFELFYSVSTEGEIQLNAQATDLVGNIGNASIRVTSLLNSINKSLLGVYLDESSGKLIVTGAVGTVRSNLKVRVAGGFFDTKEVVSSNRGSFQVEMNPYNQYSVSVYDPELNQEFAATVTYGQDSDIILSGVVRDTNDQPLVGVKVSLANTALITDSDSNGVFTFLRSKFSGTNILGDQQLIVDGTTAIVPDIGTAKKFSRTSVAITIGIRQSNILQTPIYLAPTYLDGTATNVAAAAGAVVNDVHAPGVELSIPPNAASFPAGASTALISMQTIPVERSTVPAIPEAMPKTVVALEPSGTIFNQPVQLTLPNVNEFPPKTEMLLMLMNSKTGKWEVGGSAVVSESGSSVVTKPGFGIRHFSLVYATVAGPNIRQVGAQDRPGANVLDGTHSSNISLPSFKVYGQPVTPALHYKSSWAKPTAVVSNLFDIPNQKVELTLEKQSGAEITAYVAELVSCSFPVGAELIGKCNKNKKTFYTNVQYEINYSGVTSEIQPEKIEAYLRTANIATKKQIFNNIPHMANITFGIDLLNNVETGEYLPSGIYPYQAHYDVHYKELVMGTRETTTRSLTMDAKVQSPESFTQENQGVFTNDLTDSIYVQNYRNSEAGKGWRIGGAQKIVNPSGNKVFIEESDGGISSYTLGNSITTVLDLTAQGGDANKGVALNTWPTMAFGSADGKKIYKATYSNGITKSEFANQYSLNGMVAGFDFYNYTTQTFRSERFCRRRIGTACVEFGRRTIVTNHPNSYCSQHAANFVVGSNPTQLLILADGQVIGTDSYRHSVFQAYAGISQLLLGATQSPTNFSNFYLTGSDTHQNKIKDYCNDTSGMDCSAQSGSITTFTSYNACPTQGPSGTGQVPVKGDSVINEAQSLNTPMGIVPGFFPNTVVVIDTGNHKVRALNLITQQSWVIAGNGQTTDSGDGGNALNAGLFHPRGAAYDRSGNLYISTEKGLIRKVDSNGIISTIAGDPLNGILANESRAIEMLLNKPYGITIDNERGYLYVSDTGHNRVVRVDLFAQTASTVAGNGQTGFSGDGRPALEASISAPTLLGLDSDGNLLILDSGNNKVRRVIFQIASLGTLVFAPTADDSSSLLKKEDGTWERTYRNGVKSFFAQDGNAYAAQDRLGNLTEYTYDTQKRLTLIKFANEAQLSYEYSRDKLSSIRDSAGRLTQFSYDYAGNLKKVTFPDQTTKTYTYDSNGLMLTEKNQRDLETKYIYNAYDRLSRATGPDGETIFIEDTGSANLANQSSTNPATPKSPGYDERSLSSSLVDPKGNITQIIEDFDGYIFSMRDALGKITKVKRDLKGRVTETIYPDGAVQTKFYNDLTSDIIRTLDIGTGISEEFTYDQSGNQTSIKDGNGLTTQLVYDQSNGLLLKESLPNGKERTYTYFPNGLVKTSSVKVSANKNLTKSYEYDNRGNLTKLVESDGKFSLFTSDAAGNVLIKKRGVSTTSYQYDSFNRLTKLTSPNGEVTSYGYLPTGEINQITNPLGEVASFEYNNRGNLIKKIDQSGSIHEFSYDFSGNILSEIDPNNNLKTYTYNPLNQLVEAKLPDDIIEFSYDARNRLTFLKNSVSSINYLMDTNGRPTEMKTAGIGQMANYPELSQVYSFDNAGNQLSMQSPYGKIDYSFNLNKLVQIQNSWGDSFNFDFDSSGKLTQLTRPGGFSAFSYTDSGALDTISHYSSANVLRTFASYQYDQRNYPILKRTPSGDFNYGYDPNGQLLSASNPYDKNETFSYDPMGNRILDDQGDFIYDTKKQKLESDYKYHYTYDNNGNLVLKIPKDLTKEAYKYSYSSTNQLKRIEILDSALGSVTKEISYEYDVLHRRMQKKITDFSDHNKSYTRKFIYNGENILVELDKDNNLLARYTHSPLRPDDVLGVQVTPLGASSAGIAHQSGKYFYLKDHLGTISEISDVYGDVIQKYEYSAYGKLFAIRDKNGNDVTTNPIINNTFTFTGREFDQESGLYYYRARYYDANTGRFMQKDLDPGKISESATVNNKYVYSGNSPTLYTDSSGMNFLDDLWREIGNGILILIVVTVTIMDLTIGTASSVFNGKDRPTIHFESDGWTVEDSYFGDVISSTSWGPMILLSSKEEYKGDVWKHEYGHRLQYKDWGGMRYMEFMIARGVPAGFSLEGQDDTNKWEYDADIRASRYFGEPICDYASPRHPMPECRR